MQMLFGLHHRVHIIVVFSFQRDFKGQALGNNAKLICSCLLSRVVV